MKFLFSICLLLSSLAATGVAQQSSRLTRVQIKEVEQRLADMGYWTGVVDGVFDPATRDKVSFVSAKSWAENPKLKEAALANGAQQ